MDRRVTGIGGVFFTCENPEKTAQWYKKHLGIESSPEKGGIFSWRKADNPKETCYTVWSPFEKDTSYFKPGTRDFMINYRVENLEKLMKQLKKEGVKIVGEMELYEYGKFAWIMDPDGVKIELWEPNDTVINKDKETNPPTV